MHPPAGNPTEVCTYGICKCSQVLTASGFRRRLLVLVLHLLRAYQLNWQLHKDPTSTEIRRVEGAEHWQCQLSESSAPESKYSAFFFKHLSIWTTFTLPSREFMKVRCMRSKCHTMGNACLVKTSDGESPSNELHFIELQEWQGVHPWRFPREAEQTSVHHTRTWGGRGTITPLSTTWNPFF